MARAMFNFEGEPTVGRIRKLVSGRTIIWMTGSQELGTDCGIYERRDRIAVIVDGPTRQYEIRSVRQAGDLQKLSEFAVLFRWWQPRRKAATDCDFLQAGA